MRILTTVSTAGLLTLGLSGCGCLIGCGCPGYEKDLVKLDSRARDWLPAAPAATAVFESSRGQRQTVALVRYDEAIEEFDQGDECPLGKREYVQARWAGPALPDTLGLRLYAAQVSPAVQASFSGSFDASQYRAASTNTAYAATQQLGGRTFDAVLSSQCVSRCDNQRVTELFVARGLGLVAFRLQNELWVRQ
ncbi:hypothetical protein LJ737_23700 [Hymenobacter sp. 15J16-1T3B]|uniref:hypothetical protein n=1 Tax=Hymenobacter sp. 15J16-1T3B TaxID=2886941 RepID=UPI001D1047AF|nr:hypothetical protein [Hymenobacter sp. 15J16-1T3B]MCC3160262.1 hypothetical protein [Hymenobacter sp. 15J16-1T3B]